MAKLYFLMVAALFLMLTTSTSAQYSCNAVYSPIMGCAGYVVGGGALPETCCNGIKTLIGELRSTADRQLACRCLKNLGNGGYSADVVSRVRGLPKACGIPMPYAMSTSIDCSKIN